MIDRDFDGAWWRLAFLLLCSQPLLAQAWTAQALVDETLAANPGVDALQQAVAEHVEECHIADADADQAGVWLVSEVQPSNRLAPQQLLQSLIEFLLLI